jgi:ubiquinone/menaquinone biosynthesis C-methylase UbiE
MIEQAQRYNRYGEHCQYQVNDSGDLSCFSDGAFDLVYSSRVLQHMPPEYAMSYICEFLRVLSPGGARDA